MAKRRAYRSMSFAAVFRAAALLLLVAQLGMVAHRIEHYLAPDQMECGADACDAFAPTPGPAAPVPFLPPVLFVVFFLKFWTPRESITEQPGNRLGFRAHAPPV
jgi:hypothetical protein